MDIPRFVVCACLGPLRSALLVDASAPHRQERSPLRGVVFLTYNGICWCQDKGLEERHAQVDRRFAVPKRKGPAR
jgi:hypothetical protein